MSTMLDANRPALVDHRARSITDLLTACLARYRARRVFRRNCVELESLSDRTLRDIGVTRGEIPGLVAELIRAEAVREGLFWKL